MTNVTKIGLADCPQALQKAAADRLRCQDTQAVSVTMLESTPFLDRRRSIKQYRVILNRLNVVSVLRCYDEDRRFSDDKVSVCDLTWGDLTEILRSGAPGTMMADLREAVSEKTKKLYSL